MEALPYPRGVRPKIRSLNPIVMSVQRAIQIQGPRRAKLVSDAAIPKLRDAYIRVKTTAIALNPTDWMHIDFLPSKGSTVGCDYSGTIESICPAVTNNLKVGDRVAGFVHGSAPPAFE